MRSSSNFPSTRSGAWLVATLSWVAVISYTVNPVQAEEQRYPDVVAVKASPRGHDIYDFDVTISSPYDSIQRYADAFRAMSRDGDILGERKLLHDHAGEQPFTRDLYGVVVPEHVHAVVIQARDKKYGYGGRTFEVLLPRD
jgi:hypothetical protein